MLELGNSNNVHDINYISTLNYNLPSSRQTSHDYSASFYSRSSSRFRTSLAVVSLVASILTSLYLFAPEFMRAPSQEGKVLLPKEIMSNPSSDYLVQKHSGSGDNVLYINTTHSKK